MLKITNFILIFLLLFSCTKKEKSISIDKSKPHIKIDFSFNPESYPWLMGKKFPQMAVWMNDNLSFQKTIFVTKKGATNDWFGAEKRPSALPVWHGVAIPEKKDKDGIDSVTRATPSGEIYTVLWQVPTNLIGKTIDIYIEANVSFDYNAYYKKDLKEKEKGFNGVNGQPSIIWMIPVKLTQTNSLIPQIIGHGHVIGKDSNINKDLTNITSAKTLFHKIEISFFSGN